MKHTGVMTFTVGWGDCSPSGAVFYPNYFRWFDAAMWNFFDQADWPLRAMEAEHGNVLARLDGHGEAMQRESLIGPEPVVPRRPEEDVTQGMLATLLEFVAVDLRYVVAVEQRRSGVDCGHYGRLSTAIGIARRRKNSPNQNRVTNAIAQNRNTSSSPVVPRTSH